jgi:integrase
MALKHKLTVKEIEAKSAGRFGDGDGLWLQVKPSGSKSWLFQYSSKGKERQYGLGPYPRVSLKQARKKAEDARAMLEKGDDPIDERQAARQAAIVPEVKSVSFAEVAVDYIVAQTPGWKNEKHAEQWTNTLTTYAMPVIGKLDVADIKTAHILKILTPIWSTKNETASRLRGRVENVLNAAKAHGHRSGDNPAAWKGHLDKLLPKPSKIRKVKNHPAMPYTEVSAFVRKLANQKGISARALEVLILTAARTGELIGMKNDELDLGNRCLWVIPGERMKSGKEHEVPLSAPAISILKAMPRERNNPFLFVGMFEGTHLSNMSMLAVMKELAPAYVPHGFRSTFVDWASDTTNASRSTIEMCLAHAIADKTESAYRRGGLLEKRRVLMDQWAEFLYGGKS